MEIFCAVLVPVSKTPVSKVNRKGHPSPESSGRSSALRISGLEVTGFALEDKVTQQETHFNPSDKSHQEPYFIISQWQRVIYTRHTHHHQRGTLTQLLQATEQSHQLLVSSRPTGPLRRSRPFPAAYCNALGEPSGNSCANSEPGQRKPGKGPSGGLPSPSAPGSTLQRSRHAKAKYEGCIGKSHPRRSFTRSPRKSNRVDTLPKQARFCRAPHQSSAPVRLHARQLDPPSYPEAQGYSCEQDRGLSKNKYE